MSDEHDDDDDETTYSLVMPFVVTASHGGPFDDAAYVAGWEMGRLYQRCAILDGLEVPAILATIRRANMPQADLIAMQFSRHMHEVDPDEIVDELGVVEEWAAIVISVDDHTVE